MRFHSRKILLLTLSLTTLLMLSACTTPRSESDMTYDEVIAQMSPTEREEFERLLSGDSDGNTDTTTSIKPMPWFTLYDDDIYPIHIQYPSSWEKSPDAKVFLSPQAWSDDIFRENINITTEIVSFTNDISLDKYIEVSIRNIKKAIADMTMNANEYYTIAGQPGRMISYIGSYDQYDLQWMQVMTIKDGMAYIITYTAEIKNYKEYLPTAKKIIETFGFDDTTV